MSAPKSPSPSRREIFFATCAPGIEPLLHAEIEALGLSKVERQVGGVRFEGTLADAWRANLWLRTAVRVLWRLARFTAQDADQLHAGVQTVDWSRFLASNGSLRVSAHVNESLLDHALFVEQRTKDAIADQFRDKTGARPSVERDTPDLSVYVHIYKDRCTVFADSSGESLHKRGWRRFQGRAPLAETLGAACVLAAGWDRRAPLVDPFCGSGTILIEGLLIAANIAPGTLGRSFGFERWLGHDAAAWQRALELARSKTRWPKKLVVRGYDIDRATIAGALLNVEAAGLAGRIVLERANIEDFAPKRGWNAWIVTNPPYGERVGDEEELHGLFRKFGGLLRAQAAGYRLGLLSGNTRLTRALGLTPEHKLAWKNGPLDCQFLSYTIGAQAPQVVDDERK